METRFKIPKLEKLQPLTNKEKKYIWRNYIELLIQNGYNVERFLFNPPRLKYINCTYLLDEIIKLENIYSLHTVDEEKASLKEWESFKKRYQHGDNCIK